MQISAISMAEAEAEAQLRPKFHNLDIWKVEGEEKETTNKI